MAALVVMTGACGNDRTKVVIGARTPSFRVLYRVTHSEAGPATTAWEVATMRRPFLSSDLSFKKRPHLAALGAPDTGSITDADHLYALNGGTLRRVAGRQPGIGVGDQALLDVAPDAVKHKLARVKGHKTILGRTCTNIEFVEPPVGGLAPLPDDQENHDDLCIDRGGLILREQWTLKGRVVVTREALEITKAPADAFDVSAAEPVTGSLAVPRATPMTDTAAPPAPKGYTLADAVDFFLPRSDAPDQLAYASKVWAFTKGAALITVELGAGQVVPWNTDEERPLSLGARHAASVVRSDGIEIHWENGDHWVRVRGPLALKPLVPYARVVNNWDSSPAAVPK